MTATKRFGVNIFRQSSVHVPCLEIYQERNSQLPVVEKVEVVLIIQGIYLLGRVNLDRRRRPVKLVIQSSVCLPLGIYIHDRMTSTHEHRYQFLPLLIQDERGVFLKVEKVAKN